MICIGSLHHSALHVLRILALAVKMLLSNNIAVPAALVAGCMPVYLGTPDIRPFLPHPDAALVYEDAAQISAEMLRLMNDTADYERRVRSAPSLLCQHLGPA